MLDGRARDSGIPIGRDCREGCFCFIACHFLPLYRLYVKHHIQILMSLYIFIMKKQNESVLQCFRRAAQTVYLTGRWLRCLSILPVLGSAPRIEATPGTNWVCLKAYLVSVHSAFGSCDYSTQARYLGNSVVTAWQQTSAWVCRSLHVALGSQAALRLRLLWPHYHG